MKTSKVKTPKKVSAPYLERVAYWYLERYAASEERLRRVLLRRVTRAAAYYDDCDSEEGQRLVEDIIGKLRKLNYLNDAAFAEMKAGSLRRSGSSRRKIMGKLAEAGIASDLAAQALAAADNETPDEDPELLAARTYARRRRLGPYRRERSFESDRKDLAALARAGFSFDTAKKILDQASADQT